MRMFQKVSKEIFSRDYEKKVIGTNISYYDNRDLSEIYGAIKMPQRGTKKSAGYDFFAPTNVTFQPGEKIVIPLGVKVILEDDEVLQMYVRSSMAIKHDFELVNQVGIIDADYAGNPSNDGDIMVALRYNGNIPYTIKTGEAIAQGVVVKYAVTDDDMPASEERLGGIGSTGK